MEKHMKKILIIDDLESNIKLLNSIIETFPEKYKIISQTNTASIIKNIQKQLPDIILLDIKMPKKDGYEICKEIRNIKVLPYIPIILMTSYPTDLKAKIKGYNAGADDYITRPFKNEELYISLKSVLKIKSLHIQLKKERDDFKNQLIEKTSQLKISNEHLEGFINSATDGFLLFDENFNLIMVNKSFLKTLHMKEKDIIGSNIFKINPTLKNLKRFEEYKKVIKTGKPYMEIDNIDHPLLNKPVVLFRAFKVGNGMGLVLSDLTQQIKIQKELEEYIKL